jgi:mannosyl-3-phosphoglycerate phosphatase
MTEYVIFTDLDATLLDHDTYSFEAAKPALNLVLKKEIPLILTSSKSLAEMAEVQRELGIDHPFIVENGGAICFPPGYFKFEEDIPVVDGFQIRFLGPSYNEILHDLDQIKQSANYDFRGFNDISLEEVGTLTNLTHDKAEKAKTRLCSEPLIWEDSEENLLEFKIMLQKKRLKLLKGGRFYHLMGNTDKGNAVRKLTGLYKTKFPEVQFKTIGIGDSPNDIELLGEVNFPVLVQRPDGSYIDVPAEIEVILANGIGPIGWNSAVTELLSKV